MSGYIPESILDSILARTDIVEIISSHIPLKRAGRNYKALCPFHHEKTPSFTVSADRQIYHCFGCGAGGNVFNFLQKYERMEFRETVEFLAKKAGIILPAKEKKNDSSAGIFSRLYAVNELAAKFFQASFISAAGHSARKYLLARGINEETIRSCRIGYAPDKWDALISHLRDKNIGLQLIEKAGLILPRESGGYYDRFRDRIIIPICDVKKRIIGFGARSISRTEKTSAKYVNSPETPLYVKGNCLYGLNLSKDSIRDADFVIVVEGYLDFIIPYQHGLHNIVASSGTALTHEQARLIKRYTHNVVVVYDGDSAGELATLRSLDIFIEEGMNVKIVSLPEGHDPDSYVREHGIDGFKSLITEAENLFDYKLRIMKSRFGVKDVQAKANICSEMLGTIHKFHNSIVRAEYVKQLGYHLGVSEDALMSELNKIKDFKPSAISNVLSSKKNPKIHPTEKLLIKIMLEESRFIGRIKDSISPEDFQDERLAKIVSVLFSFIEEGKQIGPHLLINHLNDQEVSGFICETAMMNEHSEADREKIVDDCIRRMKIKNVDLKKRVLQEEIKMAQHSGDEEKLNRLMYEFHNLLIKKE